MIMDRESIIALANKLGMTLLKHQLQCAVAESCTGGMLSAYITDIPGSSQWFERGFVTYSNLAKHELLGVPKQLIKKHGAVSEATARAMAEGALRNSHAGITVAITGIAGPGGATMDKPVGTVWIAWAGNSKITEALCYHFKGDRGGIRSKAVQAALERLIEWLEG